MSFPNLTKKITQEVKETNNQIISQALSFISSAFALVAALAWNEAIKELISQYFEAGSGMASRLAYAGMATLLAVIATSRLNAIGKKYRSPTPNENGE